jgi:hypothetical protein
MRVAGMVMALTASFLLPAAGAGAEGVDGTRALVCDLAEAAQCDGVAECEDVTAQEIDLPPVLLVDFAQRQLVSEDGGRTSPILSAETLDAVLLLQGNKDGRGWTMVIDRETGHLSAAVADAEGAFVLAGACTAR